MDWTPEKILAVLDKCSDRSDFPMLDNGYMYLAATRLSLYRSDNDWALVVEVFGLFNRSGEPVTSIYTFASSLQNRSQPEQFCDRRAYENYLANSPYSESSFIYPLEIKDDENQWMNPIKFEYVLESGTYFLRGKHYKLPSKQEYQTLNIELEDYQVKVFEFCRYLAVTKRDQVLATEEEKRHHILPEMQQIFQLEEWHHPDVAIEELPSESETFQQLVKVLFTGNTDYYQPTQPPNTDWRNWPEGGQL